MWEPDAFFHFPLSTHILFQFSSSLQPASFPDGFSFMSVLFFNSALGSSLEWVCLWEMIGGWVAARDSWSPWSRLCVWNTLMATVLKVHWCVEESHAAFDPPSSSTIIVWHLGCRFNSAFSWNEFIPSSYFSRVPLWHIRIILTHGSVTHRQWHFSCWNCLLLFPLKALLLSIPHSQSKHFIYQGATEYAPEF